MVCDSAADNFRFQFTPLREGRLIQRTLARLFCRNFNSRPSARGDSAASSSPITSFYFNSRPSARGDSSAHLLPSSSRFQFTPLREGRHRQHGQSIYHGSISIHAPPRGATRWLYTQPSFSRHFNSRPSARGDSKRYAISANLLFNPYKSAWLNNNATQFVEIILVIFHRIIA